MKVEAINQTTQMKWKGANGEGWNRFVKLLPVFAAILIANNSYIITLLKAKHFEMKWLNGDNIDVVKYHSIAE